MAKITYSPLRLQENEDGTSSYISDLVLVGDEFYDNDSVELANGVMADLVVDENDGSKAQLIFDAKDITAPISVVLQDYMFNSGELPTGVKAKLAIEDTNGGNNGGNGGSNIIEITIDNVEGDDNVVSPEEKTDGVTITGTSAPNATIKLTFTAASAMTMDTAVLEEELANAQAALTAIEEESTQKLTDAQDETLNGVADAQAALTSAEDDLTASPKDADLKTAVDDAKAALAQVQQDAADAVAQIEAEITTAQDAVDAAQKALDDANNGGAGDTAMTAEVISEGETTADADGHWSYDLTETELAHVGTLVITATDANDETITASHEFKIQEEQVVPVVIDTVAGDDKIDNQELLDGVAITGTAAANATVTLTFSATIAAEAVDTTALEDELTSAQDALTTIQDESAQKLTDAQDATLNGVADAQDALTTAEDDLAASPKDADLKTAVNDAKAALAQVQQDAADAVAQIKAEVTAAQDAVDAAQKALDDAKAATGDGTTQVISTQEVTAGADGKWTYSLTDTELAQVGTLAISATDGKTTADHSFEVLKDETAPVVVITDFNEKTGVVTGNVDDASAIVTLTVGGNEREISVDKGSWSYTLSDEDYQGAEFVDYAAEGSLNIIAKAVDKAENIGTAEESLAVADKIAPEIPEFNDDPEAPIIAKTTVLHGNAEPNSKVVLTFGDGGIQRTVYADETGNWQRKVSKLDLLYLEDDDTQMITAVSYDAAGNKSATATFNPVPDVIALAPTVALKNDTGESEFDVITKDATLLVTNTEVGAKVEYSVANEKGEATTWSTTQPTPVQGDNTVLVRQTDAHGNVSDATDISFTFDNQIAKLALNVAGKAAEGTTLNINIAQNVVNFSSEPETGALIEYSTDNKTWSDIEPTHALGLNEGWVRQTDPAGNVSEATKYSFTVVSGPTPVAVAAAGTTDAATGDFAFNVSEGDFTYNVAGFTVGDAIDFPATNNPTITNTKSDDGVVDLVFANNGKVATLHLTGLTAAQDAAIYSVNSFNTVFGANSLTNTGTGAVVPTPTPAPTPTPTPAPTPTPTPSATPTAVAVNAAGTNDVATGNVQLNFAAGNYAQTVTGFGSGDVLNFPDDVPATITNSSSTDNKVDVHWDANGNNLVVTLTGLTAAQDAAIYSVNSFNNVFGAGSII